MVIGLNVSTIIVGLLLFAIAAYVLTKTNKQVGAWVTVAASFFALVMMALMYWQIGSSDSLLMLGFELTEFGWFFSTVMLVVFSCVSFFNVYWMKKLSQPAAYNMLYILALIGTLGAFTAKDFIGLFVFWEMIVWASMFIIPFGKSRRASVVYYAFSTLGSLSMLYGIIYLYTQFGTFNIQEALGQAAGDPTAALIAFITIGVAGMVKLGAFPFHQWLPRAHASAPDTFSPILSGGLVKAGGFAVFMIAVVMPSYEAFSTQLHFMNIPITNYILCILGAISIVVGTLMAIRQDDFKRLIAYSSVANAGYIIIGLAIADTLSVGGAFMHIFAHAMASAAAFLAAAAVSYRTGTTKMSELGGLIHRMPITYLVYLIAIISMAGIPPMVGFISKWMLFQSMIENGMIFVAVAAFFGSIGSFLYVFRPLSAVFLGQLSPRHYKLKEAPVGMIIPMAILSVITLFFGVLPNSALRIISRIQTSVGMQALELDGTKIIGSNGSLDPTLIVIVFGIGFVIALILFLIHPKSRKVELMDTYTASEFIHTPERLHYAHSFYAPFERLYQNAPDSAKWYKAVLKKISEIGELTTYAFFGSKARNAVFWVMVVTIALLWGGSV